MNTQNKTYKSQLNKNFRINDLTINSRTVNGIRVQYANYYDKNTDSIVIKYLDQETADGGTMTPFNLQPTAIGAAAIRKIIRDKDTTIVLFADGDRICLKRHENDVEDLPTAILWALGKKVFGMNLPRQIKTAIKNRYIDAETEHTKKSNEEPKNKGMVING